LWDERERVQQACEHGKEKEKEKESLIGTTAQWGYRSSQAGLVMKEATDYFIKLQEHSRFCPQQSIILDGTQNTAKVRSKAVANACAARKS
jgi:hypothetical protein